MINVKCVSTPLGLCWMPARQRSWSSCLQAQVTRDEYVPTRRDNIGVLVINAFYLIGILLAFAVVSGIAVGGWRAFRHRGNEGDEADALTVLNLNR